MLICRLMATWLTPMCRAAAVKERWRDAMAKARNGFSGRLR